MDFISNGSAAFQVILDRIVLATPVISKVIAYPKREADGNLHLVIHIISDCGAKNTVIPKLCERARVAFGEAYKFDHVPKLDVFSWQHTGPLEPKKMPAKAQILYVRVEPRD